MTTEDEDLLVDSRLCNRSSFSVYSLRPTSLTHCTPPSSLVLFRSLTPLVFRMEGYSISPSLIILLKFLDGHLSLPSTYSAPIPPSLIQFLFERLEGLSKCVLEEGGEEGGRRARDASDAQVFQGVVLVMHCLVEIGLGREAELSRRENLGEELGDEKQEEEEGLRDENGLELVIRESSLSLSIEMHD